ncbi:hypothetical protein D920_02426 [Enterococcus faecalis 13-SD-W-01]|nr:hypothetical protein D920_02426 [Enterococcus faecalis 13-SD-W-01]
MNNLFYIYVVAKKEFREIKNSLMKLLIVFLLPLMSIGLIGFQGGSGGVLSSELNILSVLIFAGIFSAILLKDSLTREKNQRTLEVLLSSKINMKYIIIGKIVPVLLIAIFFQVIEIGFMYGILLYKGSDLVSVFTIQSILLMPVIYYIMDIIVLIITVIINDDKVSDIIGMLGAMLAGATLLYLADFVEALTFWNMFSFICFAYVLICILLTYICERILIKSMLFIKA